MTATTLGAWQRLPLEDTGTRGLTSVHQRSETLFEEVIAHLSVRAIPISEAYYVLLKQLVFENATPACQSLMKPIRASETSLLLLKPMLRSLPLIFEVWLLLLHRPLLGF